MVEQINDAMLVYHGGSEVVENPEIIIGRYKKDFYWDIGAVYQRLIEGLFLANIWYNINKKWLSAGTLSQS